MEKIKELIKGNEYFKNKDFPYFEGDLKKSAIHGQKPEVMFIGCSDSRVTPDLMLNSKPGDMFIVRNVGNFVPPFKDDEDFHGTAAAIEYALSVLNVRHIIVCGHSHCGACKSLYEDIPDQKEFVHVKTWLKLGEDAKQRTLKSGPYETKSAMYRETERNSIRTQLENLRTYPEVEKRLENNDLKIHGWYYDIETGQIKFYDKPSDSFKLVSEYL